jgi:methyl-accepting chemotaxis protein
MALPRAAEMGLKIYGLDPETLALRAEVWAIIAPQISEIVRSYVVASLEYTPFYRDTLNENADRIEHLICEYTEKLFSRPFDEDWIADAKDRVRAEIELGFDMRNRGVISHYILTHLGQALHARWRISKGRALKLLDVATRILMLDEANAVILHYDIQVRAARGHRDQLEAAIRQFQVSVQDVRQTLEKGVVALTKASTELTKYATDASMQRDSAAKAAYDTVSHVSHIAAATEELNASIEEIRRQAENGTGMTHDAVACADRAGVTIQSLSDIVSQIGSIVELISNIASHTNLLALNATIEAARAGEAGKGFSVVAAEVKLLANQTSKATQDIAKQIAVVEDTTRRSVEDITNTCKTIFSIASIAELVSYAVSEQVTATGNIAVSAADASSNASNVTNALDTVGGTIRQTQAAATSILDFSTELSERTAQINSAIDTLLKVAAGSVGTRKLVNLASANAL